MADKKPNVTIMKPGKGDAISVRHIPQTEDDRKRHAKEFREQKKHEREMKEERFAAIRERRKNKKPGGSGGSGGGINIEVTSDA